MQELESKMKDAGVELVTIQMEKQAYYVPEWKKIFVNEELDEDELKRVILHELKHALDHADYSELYKLPAYHSKMENEANVYMIDTIIKENEGQYNYSKLVEEFKLGMGYDTRYAK